MIVVSISGLYSLHASSLLPFGQPKMSPDIARYIWRVGKITLGGESLS